MSTKKRKTRIKNELVPIRDRIWLLVEDQARGKPGTFARRAGVHNSVMESIRDCVSLPIAENLIKICKCANVSADYILFGKEPSPFQPLQPIITVLGKYHDVPSGLHTEDYIAVPMVDGRIAAGYSGAIPGDYVTDMVWVHKQEIRPHQHHNLRAVKLGPKADSMVPTIRPNDIVVIDPCPSNLPPETPVNRKFIYAVRLEKFEGACAIKRFREHKGIPDVWCLMSDNPEYEPIIVEKREYPDLFIGRVIWSWTSWV